MKKFLTVLLLAGCAIGFSQPVWMWLGEMSQEQRENSEIEIVLEEHASNQALKKAQNIEDLWNSKRYDEAIAQFPKLEPLTNISEMTIANRWRKPVQTVQPDWGDDVLISSFTSVYWLSFDIQHSSGNLFAAVLSGYDAYNIVAVYISTDGGANWSETFAVNTGEVERCVSGAVLCDRFYVTYPIGSEKKNARIRRFRCSDAQPDTFSNGSAFRTIYTATQAIDEGVLISNEDVGGTLLRYFAIENAGLLRYFYDDTSCASWTEDNTNVTNASIGLDACYNAYWSSYYLFVSYIDFGHDLNVIGRQSSGWSTRCVYNNCGTYAQASAISAWRDTIFCAFEYNDSIRYVESCEGGTNWHWGYIEYNATAGQRRPDVACRRGAGQAVVYNWLLPVALRYRWRDYSGSWSTQVEIADSSTHTLCQPSIEYLGAGVYGVVYAGMMASYGYAAYFDRSDWVSVSENTSDHIDSHIMTLTPNPSTGMVNLSYSIQNPGNVKISVYDVSGRLVSTVMHGAVSAGTHTLAFNCQNYTAGTYFVQLKTPDISRTEPLLIVK
jgi:hypothetical protein